MMFQITGGLIPQFIAGQMQEHVMQRRRVNLHVKNLVPAFANGVEQRPEVRRNIINPSFNVIASDDSDPPRVCLTIDRRNHHGGRQRPVDSNLDQA